MSKPFLTVIIFLLLLAAIACLGWLLANAPMVLVIIYGGIGLIVAADGLAEEVIDKYHKFWETHGEFPEED